MKMIKLTSKNLLKYPDILEQVSQMSLDITKHEEFNCLKPVGLRQSDPMKPEDRYYNVGYILSGYYTAYVLVKSSEIAGTSWNEKIVKNCVLAMLITNNNDSFVNTMSLCYMYVHPQYRRHGYGKELMTKFLATVPTDRNVMLNCFCNSTAAMKFYEACGFNHLRATFIRRGNKKKSK